ncbi:hypothetical protein P9112_009303 [Eukaryota sp. TZLM1-RC]
MSQSQQPIETIEPTSDFDTVVELPLSDHSTPTTSHATSEPTLEPIPEPTSEPISDASTVIEVMEDEPNAEEPNINPQPNPPDQDQSYSILDWIWWTGEQVLYAGEWAGEKLADFLGFNGLKYQEHIDEYEDYLLQKRLAEQQEEEALNNAMEAMESAEPEKKEEGEGL